MAKQLPPINNSIITFDFPKFEKKILTNGLTLLVWENQELPKVYFSLAIDFGHKDDPPMKEGTAELMAHVLKKGTTNRTYRQIADEIDFVGGDLEVGANQDFFFISGNFLREYAAFGLELTGDLVMNPTFEKTEIEKERQKMVAEIENEKSSPSFLARRRLSKMIYSPHPYSNSKTSASLNKISSDNLHKLFQQFFNPSKTIMVVTGDISVQQAEERVERYLGSWENKSGAKFPEYPLPEKSGLRKVHLVDRPGSEQCNILIGNLLFNRQSPDFDSFQVMNKILGGGASGRLFMMLREEKGYTYGAYSGMTCLKESGGWQANAEVRMEVTVDALDAFFNIFEGIRNKPVTDAELKNARRFLIGNFPVRNETPAAIASLELQRELYNLPEDYWSTYLERIDRVTKNDVNEMAKKYLNVAEMAVVVVGNVKKIERKLQQFGQIEIFDLDDKLIE